MISRQGLAVIAILVAVLWGCVIREHLIVHGANQTVHRALHKMRLLRMKTSRSPAAIPKFLHAGKGRPTLG